MWISLLLRNISNIASKDNKYNRIKRGHIHETYNIDFIGCSGMHKMPKVDELSLMVMVELCIEYQKLLLYIYIYIIKTPALNKSKLQYQ